MIFFPLSLVAGFFIAHRWTLSRALLVASALFVVAVVVAWKVQGFAPSARDLLWLVLAWMLAGLGYWRRARAVTPTHRVRGTRRPHRSGAKARAIETRAADRAAPKARADHVGALVAREDLIRLGGLCAALGGLAWLVKGAAILTTGVQPPLLFEVAPGLLAMGLLALYLRLGTKTRLGTAGLVLAVTASVAWTFSVIAPVDDSEFSSAILVSTLALISGLTVLGVPVRRNASLGAGVASSLPFWLGIGMLPALAVGGALEAVDERLLEVPLVLIGALWTYLGIAIARVGRPRVD